jgi:hydrogenase nickel incorporation protein HypA/HybF
MHEWALAEAIIIAASQIAEKEKLRKVSEIKIKMGELQQIERDILEFALSQMKSDSIKEAKFIIQTVPAKMKCRACGQTWTFEEEKLDKESREAIHFVPEIAHTFIKCPKCGSPDFEIIKGRGVWLESVKGEK